jgi:hypothetical protein
MMNILNGNTTCIFLCHAGEDIVISLNLFQQVLNLQFGLPDMSFTFIFVSVDISLFWQPFVPNRKTMGMLYQQMQHFSF